MPGPLVAAVDVGTASARAGVFDGAGRMLAREVRPIALWQGEGGIAEHSSENIWSAVCEAMRAAVAVARAGQEDIAAIGFDATCSLVLRDREGAGLPLGAGGRDTIAWFDHRAIAEAAECSAVPHPVLDHSGGSLSPEMQIPKLLWLKRRRPELWARMGAAFDLSDFLTWRATGSMARSVCALGAKWTYLAHAGGWQEDFLRRAGLEDLRARAGLPAEATPVGGVAGRLTPEAAAELGLAPGIAVAAGMIDAFAGALGVLGGGGGAGEVALIAGTSTCVMSLAPARWEAPGIWGPYLGAVLPGLWVNEGGQSATGALLDYVLRLRLGEAVPQVHARVGARIGELLAQEGPQFGRTIHVLPDVNGNRSPLADPLALGVIHGLSLDGSFDATCRLYWRTAVGLALGMRQIVEHMAAHGGPRAQRLVVTGGHGRSDLLLRLYADATGLPVEVCHEPDAVLAGTAMAAAATGLHPGPAAAARAMAAPRRRLAPDPAMQAVLARDYAVFLRMQAQRAEVDAMAREG